MQRLLDIIRHPHDGGHRGGGGSSDGGGGEGEGGGEREPLRNVTLELWEQLTVSNGDMRTFLALQDGFEHLASVVRAEGGAGPITRDALAVLRNVAEASPQRQGLLCQSSALSALPAVLELPVRESRPPPPRCSRPPC